MHPKRVAEAVRRVAEGGCGASPARSDDSIPVELAGVTRFIRRSAVRYVEAQGGTPPCIPADAAATWCGCRSRYWRRVVTAPGSCASTAAHLSRCPHIDELRVIDGHSAVVVGAAVLQVSRRHTRELRDRLVGHMAATRQMRSSPSTSPEPNPRRRECGSSTLGPGRPPQSAQDPSSAKSRADPVR